MYTHIYIHTQVHLLSFFTKTTSQNSTLFHSYQNTWWQTCRHVVFLSSTPDELSGMNVWVVKYECLDWQVWMLSDFCYVWLTQYYDCIGVRNHESRSDLSFFLNKTIDVTPTKLSLLSRYLLINLLDPGVTPCPIRSRHVHDPPNSHFWSRFFLSSIGLLEVWRSWCIKNPG